MNFRLKIAFIFSLNLCFFQNNFAQSINIKPEVDLKAPANWFNLDPEIDKINGVSTERAYKLLGNKKSSPIIVAIIDSGVEIDHEDLQGKIWVNEKEIPNNQIDDDNNGYIDDVNGWDFLGNQNGHDLKYETLELTREYVKYLHLVADIDPTKANNQEKLQLEYFKSLKSKYDEKLNEIEKKGGRYYIQLYEKYSEAKAEIQTEFKVKDIDDEVLNKITLISSERLQNAKRIYKLLKEVDLDEASLIEGYDYFNGLINYGLNEDYNGRTSIVGDDLSNLNQKGYGNNEVEGPDANHGTHVAGIVTANRNNNLGISGVADNVKIMAIRAVPNGDERDKDVGNAIRYAADNGARIINMSFGKPYSPDKEFVQDAIEYAEAKGVLMIHGAGNENEDIDKAENYPNRFYKNRKESCQTWIEVGALSWKKGNDAVAEFSNYGKNNVDIFAPGVDIYSLDINNKYDEKSGTSMAAPVVTGVAALILSYFPALTAIQLKNILLNSSKNNGISEVYIPGKTLKTSFKNLSKTGGEINAYEAVLQAEKISQ